jgi:transcriptional regulator with XRE-family HTH domain
MTTLARSSRATPAVGQLLREWRERRRISQLDLSIQADISARHLSFVETGRSQPTSGMILRLSEQLDVPLRERNALLLAGGYAPAYPEHSLDEPELARLRVALRQILTGHEPYPALVVNRWWEMLDGNAAVAVLTEGCDPVLLMPPVNALRVSLHPGGMHPASPLCLSGGHISSNDCTAKSRPPAIRGWPNCLPSCRPTRAVRPSGPSSPTSLFRCAYGTAERSWRSSA